MTVLKLTINTPRPYDALVGSGLIEGMAGRLPPASAALIVTDQNVAALGYAALLRRALDIPAVITALPAGEQSKTPEGISALHEAMRSMGLLRDGLVIALGGGVVCDMANFAAATWLRGVPCAMCPTSLTAMADAAVGGKCGVNFYGAKNQIGLVRQPCLVLCDTDTLATLPESELQSGMAEIIKCGAIADEELFCALEQGKTPLPRLIYAALNVKRRYVELDEYDNGPRHALNFGHTLGHALELTKGLNHGQAVARGMLAALRLGENLGVTQKGLLPRVEKLLQASGLGGGCDVSSAAFKLLAQDKKAGAGGVEVVLLKRIGEAVPQRLTLAELEGAWS